MNMEMREHESQQIIASLGRVFQRRKTILVVSLIAVLAPVLYYNQTTKPLYEASTSLVFEELGSAMFNNDFFSSPRAELQLFNRIEEIKSRAFAYDVASALPDNLKARFPRPAAQQAFDQTQQIADIINRSLTAAPLRNSNLVRIRVRLEDPYLCMAVANLSLDALQERNYRIRHEGVADLGKFIEDQLERFRGQLDQSERQLMQFKQANRITSLSGESQEILRRMTDAEVLLNTTRADRGAAQQRLASVETTLTAQRSGLVTAVTNTSNPSAQRLKDQLVALQSQYAQLVVQDYPPEHPQRVKLQEEIEQTKSALAGQASMVARGSYVGDPIAQIERRVDQSVNLQIEVESMRARESALQRTLGGYREHLARLPGQEVDLARLTLDRDVNARIYTSLLERREEVRISEAKQIPNTRVIDRAMVPQSPVKPRKKLNLLLGTVVGLLLGSGIGLVIESRAGKLGSTQEFEEKTGWTVLALVPQHETATGFRGWIRRTLPSRMATEAERSMALVADRNPDSPPGAAYFMLRTRLELLGLGTKYRSLLLTSAWPQDGKSTTLSNLAATFGAAGKAALVIDAELRRPVQHSIFGASKAPGLSDLLLVWNGEEAERMGIPGIDRMFQPTRVDGVTLLASGKRLRETQWETAKSKLPALLDVLENKYDVALMDSASPILVHDTLTLCGMVDAVIVVVNGQAYDENRLMETKRLLEHAGANIIGAVVNKVDPGGRYSFYYSHHYQHQS